MKILFFLEPRIELSAYFRYATLRNSIIPQLEALRAAGADARVLMGDGVARKAVEENLAPRLGNYSVVNGDHLAKIAGHYDVAAQGFMAPTPDPEKCRRLAEVIEAALPAGYVPDLVISWESPIPYMSTLFPSATILYQWPGLLSRPPFPEFVMFDTGLLANSSLKRLTRSLSPENAESWRCVVSKFRDPLLDFDPTRDIVASWRGKFKRLALLPLQIDNYFTVTVPLGGRSNQFGVIKDALRELPADVGLVVTEYRSKNVSSNVLTPENVDYLRKKFPNFLFDEDLNRIPQVSQYLALTLDGVITISSSVGVQSAIWQKPLLTIGESHVSALATASSYSEFAEQLARTSSVDRSDLLCAAFMKMNVALEDIKRRPADFLTWLSECERLNRKGELGGDLWPDFYKSGEDLAACFEGHGRLSNLLADIGYFSRFRSDEGRGICKELADQIDRRPIISFDIFDTLLLRPFMRPTEVFNLMERRVREICGRDNFDYVRARRDAERAAFQHAVNEGRGETTLDEIYDVFCEQNDLPPELGVEVKNLEIDTELRILYRRDAGYKAYMQAVAQKKRIILVSDMYLPASVLRTALAKNGYDGYEKLYVSSEVGVKKHSGRLFDYVLGDLGVSADSVLHVGDNVDADVKMAKARGIKPFHLTKASDVFVESSAYRIWKRDADRHGWEWRVPLAIVANELGNNPYSPHRPGTLFNGKAFNLGFYGAGPLMLGFCKWLLEKAIDEGYERLYFLARDGKIIKEIYDLIAPAYAGAPQSEYLLCSRRAVNLAKVERFSDIVDLVDVDYANKTRLGFLLENRFGLRIDQVSQDSLMRHGLSWEMRITAEDRSRVKDLLAEMQEVIFDVARRERENYLAYLNDLDFLADCRAAVVDIGYAGTMQESLRAISGRQSLDGLYLMTFRQAIKRVKQNGMRCFGYLGDFVDRHDTYHPFCRHVPLYETLFSSTDTSFLRMERDWTGRLFPVFLPESAEERSRSKLVASIHAGAVKFCKIFADAIGEEMRWIDIEPNKSIRAIQDYFDNPHHVDAAIFAGLRFEDAYGGAGFKVILPSLSEMGKADATWRRGREAILASMTAQTKKPRPAEAATPVAVSPSPLHAPASVGLRTAQHDTLLRRVVSKAVLSIADERKRKKFERDPVRFFEDSKNRALRKIGAIYKESGHRNRNESDLKV